jgi:hypothetical protein
MRLWRRRVRRTFAVPSLREVQRQLRDAIVNDDGGSLATLLVGGRDPAARLAVYRATTEEALLQRFSKDSGPFCG